MKVQIIGLGKLQAKLNRPRLTGAQTDRFLRQSGEVIKGNIIDRAPRFDGALANSIVAELGPGRPARSVIVGTDKEYAAPVEFGRRPGRMPPPQAVAPWARAHGMDPFVLARSIGRKGTRPHPFMRPGLDVSRGDIVRLLGQAGRAIEAGAGT